jgi:hypothetical protein
MQEEIWKDIPGYEGLYQVSNLGRVYSLPKEWFSGKNTISKHKGKILKKNVTQFGYEEVSINKNFKRKTIRVHQLVAMAFLNHTRNGHKLVVDHINTNKLDNRLENLQIISSRLNLSKDKKGSSKYTGVSWNKNYNKWVAQIYFNKKTIILGYFTDEYEAHLAYKNKLKEIS